MIFNTCLASSSGNPPIDTVIIGAGAVGLTMAIDLARRGERVAVLEAGPGALSAESQRLFGEVLSEGRRWDGGSKGRYRALGGTTNFWGGQIVRIDPLIFEGRPWIEHADWPISSEELAPWYVLGEKIIGGKQLPDEAVWEKVGALAPCVGADLEAFLSEWIPEPNFSYLFKDEIKRSLELNIYLNSQVVGFDLSNDSGHIASALVRRDDGSETTVSGRRFVIACGTVEAIRLLLFPLANKARAPWSGNEWLGSCFMDHIDCFAGKVHVCDKVKFAAMFDNIYVGKTKYSPKLKLSAGIQANQKLLNIAAHLVYDSAQKEHLDNLKIFLKSLARGQWPKNVASFPRHVFELAQIAMPLATRYLVSNRVHNLYDKGVRLRITAEQCPYRPSSVSLDTSLDSMELPCARVNWQLDGKELEAMAVFVELVDEEFRRQNLARIEIDSRLAARDVGFLDTADDAYHHMGGARMGVDETQGVVDSDLKVFGSANLYVAGAAVFPSAGFANPTLTAVALGLRLSAHLRGLHNG